MTTPILNLDFSLRPARADDFVAVSRCISDARMPADLPLVKLWARGDLDKWYARTIDQVRQGSAYIYAIDLSEKEPSVGQVSLIRLDADNAWCLAYWLHPDHWKKGYMCAAVKSVLSLLFKEDKVADVRAGVAVSNIGSMNLLQKVGMQRVPGNQHVLGSPYPVDVEVTEFWITKEAWEKWYNPSPRHATSRIDPDQDPISFG